MQKHRQTTDSAPAGLVAPTHCAEFRGSGGATRRARPRTSCTATTASLYSLVIARDGRGLLLWASCWRPELSDDGSRPTPASPVSPATAAKASVLNQLRRRRLIATVVSR